MTINPKSTMSIGGHPIHPLLIPFPIALFIAAAATDIAWLATDQQRWFEASYWLIAAGVVTGVIAAVVGLGDFLGEARIRNLSKARWHTAGNVAVLLIEGVNWYLRHFFAAGEIFPEAFYLSLAAVVLLGVTGWLGGEMVYRHRVGVLEPGETTASETARAPTSDEIRVRIDRGLAGDKVAGVDPAAAPLGSDDEAGGFPPTAQQREMAAREMAAREAAARRGGNGGAPRQ